MESYSGILFCPKFQDFFLAFVVFFVFERLRLELCYSFYFSYVCVFLIDSYVMISDFVVIECPQECLNFSGHSGTVVLHHLFADRRS